MVFTMRFMTLAIFSIVLSLTFVSATTTITDINITTTGNVTADWGLMKINWSDIQNHPLSNYYLKTTIDTNLSLYFRNNTNEGYVGIFKTLNVTGTSYLGDLIINANNISVDNILSKSGSGILFWDNVKIDSYNFSVGTSDFFVNNNLGRVGIGTTSPLSPLHIKATGENIDDQIAIEGQADTDKWHVLHDSSTDALKFRFNTDVTSNFEINSNGTVGVGYADVSGISGSLLVKGNVGIGTASPDHLLDLESASGVNTLKAYRKSSTVTQSIIIGSSDAGGAGSTVYVVRVDGDNENTNNRYTGISDIRLKENIAPAPNVLDDLSQLNIIKYSLIDNNLSEADSVGISAQEVEQLDSIKHIVGESSLKKGYKTLALNQFVPVLVKAVQELSKKNKMMEASLCKLGEVQWC